MSADIQQNTLYLLTPASYVNRDHLTLQVAVPVYPDGIAPEKRRRDAAIDVRKLSIPIHHLESICVFGSSTISPPARDLCWQHGVAVNFLSEDGYLQARMTGVADTSVMLRRSRSAGLSAIGAQVRLSLTFQTRNLNYAHSGYV